VRRNQFFKHFRLAYCLFLLLLAACTPSPTPFATPEMPTPTQALPTATVVPPTRTKASPTRTQPPPTPEVSEMPDLSLMTVNTLTSISTYGPWTAEVLLASFVEKDYARLMLHRVDERGYLWWKPYEEWSESGLGDSLLSEFYWSVDGRFLYFAHKGAAHPCGFPFTTNLRRVDLNDGSLTDIPLTGIGLDDITISPGAEILAYRTEDGILVYELETGQTRTLSFKWPQDYYTIVGAYAWSPDEMELVFSVTEALCGMPGEPRSSLQVIHVETGEVRAADDQDTWLYLPEKVSVDPIASAVIALQDYLNSLYWGGHGGLDDYTYERAADLYAGSYETLVEMNPGIDPDDRVAFLRHACEVNGFQCLRLYDVISSNLGRPENDARLVFFTVRLMNPDGSLFALGSCCGSEAEPPQTRFGFTVRQMEDGTFKVLHLPPYVP